MPESTRRPKILVLHGPNLNLLGRREPHIYGATTLEEVDQRLHALAAELSIEIETFQSNHEGALVDRLQSCMDTVQGCLINPAALTHTSVALHDCIKAMPFPVIEVHLSNPQAREEFRKRSITGEAAKGAVMGFGWRSYTTALRGLVDLLTER
ncbi:MAG: type II 3-dehydroquinate dehydratase [Chloroflexota bacterium]